LSHSKSSTFAIRQAAARRCKLHFPRYRLVKVSCKSVQPFPRTAVSYFFADGKKTKKNICKTYMLPPHRRLHKLDSTRPPLYRSSLPSIHMQHDLYVLLISSLRLAWGGRVMTMAKRTLKSPTARSYTAILELGLPFDHRTMPENYAISLTVHESLC